MAMIAFGQPIVGQLRQPLYKTGETKHHQQDTPAICLGGTQTLNLVTTRLAHETNR
jgi:hypothetical protein